jgi:hypothetical protein
MLSATIDPNTLALLNMNIRSLPAGDYRPSGGLPVTKSTPTRLPWLLGAAGLAYLIFFRKKA